MRSLQISSKDPRSAKNQIRKAWITAKQPLGLGEGVRSSWAGGLGGWSLLAGLVEWKSPLLGPWGLSFNLWSGILRCPWSELVDLAGNR